jgi:hypothetical protein
MKRTMSAKAAKVLNQTSEELCPHQTGYPVEAKGLWSPAARRSQEIPRCLVLGGVEQSIDTGPVKRVDDPNEDFDLILTLNSDRSHLSASELEVLLARCSNPAAPLICNSA